MTNLPQSNSCFACGKSNPLGLNLKFQVHGESIETEWIPEPHHTGFANTVHGGLIATVLDEIMAWTCGVIGGSFAYSVDLQIRYSNPLDPGQRVRGRARIQENRRGRIFLTEGELLVGETKIASATGKYFAVKPEVEALVWNEFGSEGETLKQQRALQINKQGA